MVLACAAVVTSLILATVHVSLRQMRQVRNEVRQEQCRWLLDAGIRRAIAQARQVPDYDGETIQVARALSNASQARVLIRLERHTEPSRARVTVEARLDSGDGEPGSGSLRSRAFDLSTELGEEGRISHSAHGQSSPDRPERAGF
jgi:hypothetical protein